MFKVAHAEACTQNQQQSAERVKDFETYKQKVYSGEHMSPPEYYAPGIVHL